MNDYRASDLGNGHVKMGDVLWVIDTHAAPGEQDGVYVYLGNRLQPVNPVKVRVDSCVLDSDTLFYRQPDNSLLVQGVAELIAADEAQLKPLEL